MASCHVGVNVTSPTAGVGITVFCGVPRFCVGSVIEARPIVTVPQTTVETHLA
jgi:LysR family transcriptional regulator, benzoate and cis,cis-muconate-responsive activator of ben and cat genes